MSVITVNKDELFEIIQYINLIRARIGSDNAWTLYPVLYSGFDSIDIIIDAKYIYQLEVGQKVYIKFQKHGYEYLVDGEVIDTNLKTSATVTIKFLDAKKYYNLRKYIRFEVELCSQIKEIGPKGDIDLIKQYHEAAVLNLSKGGAMLSTKADFASNSIIEIFATFVSGICFNTKARILRRQIVKNEKYNYGVQFFDTSEEDLKNLSTEIAKLEKAYFSSLREYKKSQATFDTKFAIFSSDVDESYGIREALVKLGAENFDVVNNFKFYGGFISEEKPKFLILDLSIVDGEIEKLVENIKADFPQMAVLMILPIKYQQDEEFKHFIDKLDVLYKPLIYNEFEDKIIKYL